MGLSRVLIIYNYSGSTPLADSGGGGGGCGGDGGESHGNGSYDCGSESLRTQEREKGRGTQEARDCREGTFCFYFVVACFSGPGHIFLKYC